MRLVTVSVLLQFPKADEERLSMMTRVGETSATQAESRLPEDSGEGGAHRQSRRSVGIAAEKMCAIGAH